MRGEHNDAAQRLANPDLPPVFSTVDAAPSLPALVAPLADIGTASLTAPAITAAIAVIRAAQRSRAAQEAAAEEEIEETANQSKAPAPSDPFRGESAPAPPAARFLR